MFIGGKGLRPGRTQLDVVEAEGRTLDVRTQELEELVETPGQKLAIEAPCYILDDLKDNQRAVRIEKRGNATFHLSLIIIAKPSPRPVRAGKPDFWWKTAVHYRGPGVDPKKPAPSRKTWNKWIVAICKDLLRNELLGVGEKTTDLFEEGYSSLGLMRLATDAEHEWIDKYGEKPPVGKGSRK